MDGKREGKNHRPDSGAGIQPAADRKHQFFCPIFVSPEFFSSSPRHHCQFISLHSLYSHSFAPYMFSPPAIDFSTKISHHGLGAGGAALQKDWLWGPGRIAPDHHGGE
jgi:hypothetical protein